MKYEVSKLGNNKYSTGNFKKGFDATRGWFVGDFFPDSHANKTRDVEIMYKKHTKGDIVVPHYHKEKVEVLIVLSGKMEFTVNGEKNILNKDDFIFTDKNNVNSLLVLEDSEILAIHSPSLPKDKYLVDPANR